MTVILLFNHVKNLFSCRYKLKYISACYNQHRPAKKGTQSWPSHVYDIHPVPGQKVACVEVLCKCEPVKVYAQPT